MRDTGFPPDGVIEDREHHDDQPDSRGHEDQSGDHHLTHSEDRPSFSLFRIVTSSVVASAMVVGSFTVKLPLLTVEPGPVRDAASLVRIENAQTFSSQGKFLVTTVSLYEATLAGALRGMFSPNITVVDRSAIFPPDKSKEEISQETSAQMDDSQHNATVAALRHLGYELPEEGALVRTVFKGRPAEAELKPGDIVVAVDGRSAKTPKEVTDLIGLHQSGEKVVLSIKRGEEVQEHELATVADEREGKPLIGVELIQGYRFPFPVKIDAGQIGGPSAGLTFALTIVDLLTPEDLTHGMVIADTGQIDSEGNVGPIGGISQKVAAAREQKADVFLVPKSQVAEARRAARGDVQIVGVSSLREALDALRNLAR